jgi:nitroreductase
MTVPAPPLNRLVPGTVEMLLTRRSGSAKRMTGPGPDARELETILAVAARTPDHGKLFPWRFILFQDEARRSFGEFLADIVRTDADPPSAERLQIERDRFLRAPVIVCVVSSPRQGTPIPEWEQVLSAGAVCQNMLTAATALGFVANWITEWPAYSPAVWEHLHLKGEEKIAGFVYIGRPAEPLAERPRPVLSEIVQHYRR